MPYMFVVHKTLRLAFKVALPGISLGSFTLDNESKVYLSIFHKENPPCCTDVIKLPRILPDE